MTIRSESPAGYTAARANDTEIVREALRILDQQLRTQDEIYLTSPSTVRDYLRLQLATRECEIFAVLFLTNRHRVIDFQEMFRGTIDGASVHPREVVKEVLRHNAAAVILCHFVPGNKMAVLCRALECALLVSDGSVRGFPIGVEEHNVGAGGVEPRFRIRR